MILYDIIRDHILQIPPQGEVLERTIFLNYFYLDVDVRSGVSHFIQEKDLVQVTINKKMVRGERGFFCFFR